MVVFLVLDQLYKNKFQIAVIRAILHMQSIVETATKTISSIRCKDMLSFTQVVF